MAAIDHSLVPAVLPILPAVHSVLAVLLLCASGLVTGIWAMRHPRSRSLLFRFLWSQRWSLLSLAMVISLVASLPGWLTSRETRKTPLPTVQGNWSARGGDRRLGCAPDAVGPVDGLVQWVGGVDYTFYASPAVVEDRVYAVGFSGDRSRLFCWDARSGKSLWTRAIPGFRASFSSPVIHDGCLFVGEGLHHTPRCSLFAVDLSSGNEGNVLWRFPTDSHVECTPVIAGGLLYATAGDDGVYALVLDGLQSHAGRHSADNGEQQLSWHVSQESAPDVETSLCYYDGRLFVGLGNHGNALVAFDARSGVEVGRIPMPFSVHGLPATADGRLYVGMGTGDYVNHTPSQGQVVCVDLESFTIEWSIPLNGSVLGAVVCDTDRILFGCTDGSVYAVSHDGDTLATWNSRAPILASPALAGDTLFAVNQSGVLFALDRISLRPLWESRLGAPGNYLSSPVVSNGRLFVGTPSDGFLCIGDASADGDVMANTTLQSDRGQMVWRARVGDEILAAPAVTESTLIVLCREGQTAKIAGYCLRESGAPMPAWTRGLESTPLSIGVAAGEIAIVAAADELLALDAPTGSILWTAPVHSQAPPVIEDNLIWVPDSRSGTQSWTIRSLHDGQPLSTTRQLPPHPIGDRDVGLEAEGGRLLCGRSGSATKFVWYDLSSLGQIIFSPVIDGDRVYAALDQGELVGLEGVKDE